MKKILVLLFLLSGLFASIIAAVIPPTLVTGSPSAGARVKRIPTDDTAYYSLYLPTNYLGTGTPFPVIFESAGNGTSVGGAYFGYGLTHGANFIWVVCQFLSNTGDTTTLWWGSGTPGSTTTTIAGWKKVIADLKSNFNVDTNHFYLCGFSRGAIACGAIGLGDSAIASTWAGFAPFSHYDGFQYTTDVSNVRTLRGAKKPHLITWGDSSDTGSPNSKNGFYNIADLCFKVTAFGVSGYAHNPAWILDSSKTETKRAKAWLKRAQTGDTSSCGN